MSLKEYVKDRVKLLKKDKLTTIAVVGVTIFFLGLAFPLHMFITVAGLLTYVTS